MDDYKDFDVNELELVRSSQGVSVEKRRGVFMLIFFFLLSLNAVAYDFEVDGIYYNITSYTNMQVEVTFKRNSIAYKDFVTIPENVKHDDKTYSVTSIGNLAFNNTPWYNNKSDGLLYINNMLYDYKGIMPSNTHIDVKEGITHIGNSVFSNCTNLTSITIPNSLTNIGSSVFKGCTNLTSIIIPNSVISIGDYTFWDCI